MSEVLIGKQESLERCIKRVREVWGRPSDISFERDLDKQELITLNLIRSFETLLDMANHLLRAKKLGWPKNNAETFDLIAQAGLIDAETRDKLKRGNAMRNILVHRYAAIDLDKVRQVIELHLDEMLAAGGKFLRHGAD